MTRNGNQDPSVDESPATGSAGPAPDNDTGELTGGAQVLLGFVTVVVFAALVAVVYGYARFGGPFVHGLSEEIGEIVAQQARTHHEAGDLDRAIELYETALDRSFEDPRQRGWALRWLGEALFEAGRYDEAVEPLEAAVASYPDDLIAQSHLTRALRLAGRHEDSAAAAEAWYDEAVRMDDTLNRFHARYHFGQALEDAGDLDAALEAYLEGHDIEPGSMNTFHAAQLLVEQGDSEAARPLFETYLESGSGWRLESARSRLDAITADGVHNG